MTTNQAIQVVPVIPNGVKIMRANANGIAEFWHGANINHVGLLSNQDLREGEWFDFLNGSTTFRPNVGEDLWLFVLLLTNQFLDI